MVDSATRFGIGSPATMAAGLRMPSTTTFTNLPDLAPRPAPPVFADAETERQQGLNRIANVGRAVAPRIQPPPEAAGGIFYNRAQDRFAVGGVEFGSREYDVALQAAQRAGQPGPTPEGPGWERISQTDLNAYLSSISEGRGVLGNIGMGFRDVGQGLVGGAGRGLQMLGYEGAGQALVSAGEAIGPSAADQARDAAIAEQQGLFGKIGTAAVRSIPTLGLSVAGGVGAAGLAVRAGAAAGSLATRSAALGGVATTVLPLELQSSWEAAEQGGYDTADPNIQTEILYAALTKTAGQTLAPAFIASGFSPALRRVVSESAQRTMGSRIARGIGAGALEGSAEAFAEIVDRVVFDPELRAEFNEADWAALAPLLVNKYGEGILVAFGAGFLLGGPLGAMGTPTAPQVTPPPGAPGTPGATPPTPNREGINSGQATDVLTGATLEPQAAPAAPEVRPEVAEAERLAAGWMGQPTILEGSDAGPLGPRVDALSPEEQALSDRWAARTAGPLELTPDMRVEAPPLALPAPASGGTIIPQAPLQLTPEMRVPAPLQLAPEQRVDTTLPLSPDMRTDVGAVPQRRTDLPPGAQRLQQRPSERAETYAPPVTTGETAIGAQLGAAIAAQQEQQNRLRQQAEQAAAVRAQRETEFEAAQQQVEQQAEQQRQQRVDAEVAWEQLRPENSRATFDRLTPAAQEQWSEAVSDGTADQALFDQLRRRVPPGRAQPLLETPTVIEPAAAPTALPEGVFGTADNKPFKSALAANGQKKRVASREKVPASRLDAVEVPGGWGLQLRPETPPATPTPSPRGERLRRGAPRATQEPSPAPRAARQRPETGERVRGEDTQGQAAPEARGPDTFEQTETPAQRRVAPTPGRGLSQTEREAAAKSARAADLLIGRDRRQPPKRTQEQLEADRAREEAARAEAARRTETEAAARREARVLTETPVVPVAQSEAARAWAEAQRENPDIDLDYDALPNAEKTRWAKEVRAGKQTAEKARRTYERVVGPLAEREAAAETEALVVAIQDLELDVVQRGFDGDKQDAAVELMRLMSDPNTPTDIQNDIRGILEGNLTPSQYLTVKQQTAALEQQMSGAPRELLGADMDTQIIVQTMSDLNNGKLNAVTPMMRSKLRDAWNKIKGTNPEFAGEPLANYIDEGSPAFFNFGPRNADGVRPVVSKDTGRTKLSSFNEVGTPMPKGRVEMLARSFVRGLAVRPKLAVFRNVAELQQRNPALFAAADAARPQGDFTSVEAAAYSFGDGNVIVFSDGIIDEAHLRAVMAHETLGHFGMRAMMGDTPFNRLMDALYDTSDSIRSAADAAMANRKMSKAEAVEEYLADFAAVLDTSLIARIWASLKNGLNKLGVKFGDDAARYLVTQARRYVRTGQQGTYFINADVAQRLYAIESGADPDGTGRFAPANSVSAMGAIAGNLDGSTLPYTKEGLVSNFRSVVDTWDRIKADVFSLTNYRAKQNPGLQKFYDLIMRANRMAMRIKNEANEAMAQYLNPTLNLGIVRLGNGVTKTQKQAIDEMLYAAQRFAVAKSDLRPDAKRPPLVSIVDGEPVVNQDRLKELQKQGRRTIEEFRDGFDYTVPVDTPMTPEQQQVLRTERDAELAKATTDAERKAITDDFKQQIDAPTYMRMEERRYPGIPGLTKDSIEWKNYLIAREQVEKVEIELLKAHYAAHLKTIDNQLYEINEVMSERMTPQDREFLLRMNEKYRELYTADLEVTEDGQVKINPESMRRADEFVVAVNAAVIATRGSDRNAEVLAAFDAALHDDINTAIENFKSRFAPRSEQERFVVQNKIKEIALDEIARNDGGFFTERTIATGYVPVLREGRFQVRMVAVDPATGRRLKMKDTFQQQLSYHQVANLGEAAVLRDRINELFGNTAHEVAVWDNSTREYKVQKVRLEAVSDAAADAIAAPPQLNLNEFLIGLRRFSINLDPKKMEDVVVTLTKQNSRARNRLQRAFVPGADTDAAKAISGHIESRASTIAKTMMRPDLDRLMNMNLEQSRQLWNASDDAKLARLKERFDATQADPNATYQQKLEARRDYDAYVYQRQNTLRTDKEGVGMAQRYYSEAARALSFMESQKNLDESDLGSGDVASRVRGITSMFQLGASPATAMLNLIALGTNTTAYLATYNNQSGFGGGFGFGPSTAALFKAIHQVGNPGMIDGEKNTAAYYRKLASDQQALRKIGLTADEALFLAREIEEGVAIPALSNSLIASARGRMTGAGGQKLVDGWMAMFNRTESASRRAALLAAYRLQYDRGIQSGLDPEVAQRRARDFAVKAAEDTLGEYSVMNRPALWRGGIQQFMYMYKIFPTMSVQLLRNLPRSGQLAMLGGLIALSGISGLPFAQDLEDLIDTISAKLGLKTPSIRLEIAKALDDLMPGMSQVALNGFVNAYAPGDIGARTSLGDLFPGTSMFLPGADVGRELMSIAGPVMGMGQGLLATTGSLSSWAAYTSGLSDRPASLEGVARNAPVTMVRAWADALAYTQSGAVVDKRGYVISDDMNAMTVMARALGFFPSAAAEQYGMVRVAQRVGNMQRDIAASFYNAYVQARLRGDMAQANQIAREVRTWNQESRGTGLEIRNFETNAARRFREAQRTAAERTIRSAPRNLQGQYERAMELLGY